MSKTNNLIAAVVMTLTGVGVQAQQAVVPGRSVGTITLGMPAHRGLEASGEADGIRHIQLCSSALCRRLLAEQTGSAQCSCLPRRQNYSNSA